MKPILFNTPMVQAILNGRKTVTRRVVKPHNPIKSARCGGYHQGNGLWISYEDRDKTLYIKDYSVSACWISARDHIKRFAKYKPDDILYVRETWTKENGEFFYRTDFGSDFLGPCETLSGGYPFECTYYPGCDGCTRENRRILWHPSIHMPKEAARLFLRVTDVQVERLQDITPLDCEHEGAFTVHTPVLREDKETYLKVSHDFMRSLWDSTIKPADIDHYGWAANPWVWVIKFECVPKSTAEER